LAGAHPEDSALGEGFADQPSVALSADGGLRALATARGEVWLWSVSDRRAVLALQAHDTTVWGVAISADGRIVASGGGDDTVRLWDSSTGQPLASLEGHPGGVWGWLCPPTVGSWRVATAKGLSGCGYQRRAASLVNPP
jgi:WD40 repeat protein